MDAREQLSAVCRWNKQQAAELRRLRRELRHIAHRNRELEATNAELRAERVASEVLLGEAMDAALEATRG